MSDNPLFRKKKPLLDSSTILQRSNSAVWSFPKAQRFAKTTVVPDPYLVLPSTLSTKFTTLGKGMRRIQKIDENPCPGQYEIPSQFDPLSKRSGVFFGTEPRRRLRKPEIRPGPGSYDLNRSMLSNNKGVKLKSRHNSQNSCIENPAPNNYVISEKAVTRNRFSGTSLGRGKRSQFYNKAAVMQDIPGPGAYTIGSQFDNYSTPVLRNKLSLSQIHRLSELELI